MYIALLFAGMMAVIFYLAAERLKFLHALIAFLAIMCVHFAGTA